MSPHARGESFKRFEVICQDPGSFSEAGITPKVLVSALQGMIRFTRRPSSAVMMRVEGVCMARSMQDLACDEVLCVIQGMVKANHQPSERFLKALESRCQGVDMLSCNPAPLSQIIQCMVRLQFQPSAAIVGAFKRACEINHFQEFTVQDLARTIVSLDKINDEPGESFLIAFGDACLRHGFAAFPVPGLASIVASIVSTLGKLKNGTAAPSLMAWSVSGRVWSNGTLPVNSVGWTPDSSPWSFMGLVALITRPVQRSWIALWVCVVQWGGAALNHGASV